MLCFFHLWRENLSRCSLFPISAGLYTCHTHTWGMGTHTPCHPHLFIYYCGIRISIATINILFISLSLICSLSLSLICMGVGLGRGKTRRVACDRGQWRLCNCHRGTGSTATRQYSVQSKVAFGLTRVSRAGLAGWVLPASAWVSFLCMEPRLLLLCYRPVRDRPHQHHPRQGHAPTESLRFQGCLLGEKN
jgi:hypothetical protein